MLMNPHRTRLQRFIAAHSPDPAKRAAAASNPPAPLVGPPTKGMPDHKNKPLGEKGDSMTEPTSSAARAPDTRPPHTATAFWETRAGSEAHGIPRLTAYKYSF